MLKKLLAIAATSFALIAHAAVDVNTASVADLDSIKGIGPGTSAQIMEARNSAKFKDWADFTSRVKGIGDKRAAKLSEAGLTVSVAGLHRFFARRGMTRKKRLGMPSSKTAPTS
jgi:competence protein ComEA